MRRASGALLPLLLLLVGHAGGHGPTKPAWPAGRVLLGTPDGSTLAPSAAALTRRGGQRVAVAVSRPRRAAAAGDLVALYPAGADPRAVVPITYANLSAADPRYASTGRGSVAFRVYSFRADLVFVLLTGGTFAPTVVATSARLRDALAAAPAQLHLAPAATPRGVVAQWVSGSGAPQALQWWPAAGGGASAGGDGGGVVTVGSSVRRYGADAMCGEPASSFGANVPAPWLHAALIADVPPGATLRYRVGSAKAGWSDVRAFTAAPAAADVAAGRATFTFLAFADVGQDNMVLFNDTCPPYCPGGWAWEGYGANSSKLAPRLAAEDAQLGLLVGDLAYANGVAAEWDYFGHQFDPAFSAWPLAVATGNHERDWPGTGDVLDGMPVRDGDSGGECNVPYTYRFYTPAWEESAGPHAHRGAAGAPRAAGPQPPAAPPAPPPAPAPRPWWWPAWLWRPAPAAAPPPAAAAASPLPRWPNPYRSYYAFARGGVAFLMLDSEAPSHPGSAQHEFAKRELAAVNRRETPWIVVALHRCMVCPTANPVNVANAARLQADWEELFLDAGVDLVLQGHDHAYARTCPWRRGACVGGAAAAAAAPPAAGGGLPVLAAGAAPVYVLAGHAGAGFTHAFPDPLPPWVAAGLQDRNGYLRVRVTGDRLTLVTVSTDDGAVMDGVTLIRAGGAQSPRREQ
ncbi:PAP1 [Scenedesmus sp. PABB004]|nr:PAP1 [Scenedesmus sp. PABB004]